MDEKQLINGKIVNATPEEIQKRRELLRAKKRRSHYIHVGLAVLAVVVVIGAVFGLYKWFSADDGAVAARSTQQPTEDPREAFRDEAIASAEQLAAGYDYEQAVAVLQQIEGYENDTKVSNLISQYQAQQDALVEYPISEVTHIFFHTLINNCDKVFDGDYKQGDYNQVMTTVEEFNAIMQSMYDRGYVLVELSDMAGFETAEDGTQVWTEKKLLLPEGKKAFVLSQDDVSYYEYMEGDGYPSRLLIGEDGRITNEVINDDGTASYGSFDLVPLLEDFIAVHPDFSYKGARGYLALTGYDGILGYRTADKYKESLGEEEWQRQVEECKQVVNRLLEQGWEFASHSWGHLNLGQVSYSTFVSDSEKWEAQVRPLLENNGTYKVDTMIFAFGNDIGSWTPYTSQNERFLYLRDRGFHYFCNVDSSQTWVQNNSELQYLRQGRRNLDGQRMWQDMTDDSVDYLSDLFDVNAVFDQRRPTPVE